MRALNLRKNKNGNFRKWSILKISLIIHSLLYSKWGAVFVVFTLCEPSIIRLDEFDAVGDHLYGAAFDPFICFPLGMVEDSGDSYFSALVQMLFADLREAIETGHLDPAGFLFACPESQVE